MLENHVGDDTMRDLNRRVQVQHQSVEKVARDFLAGQP
jgi:glycine betaine/choline ABC-type transport system substrate-binding protein